MKNQKYTHITTRLNGKLDISERTLLSGAFTLSHLMTDEGERKDIGFFAVQALLSSSLGSFHILTENKIPVAYALLGYGSQDNPTARRLNYFAVERGERGKGVGSKALKLLIEEEVDMSTGLSVSCHPSLREFYDKLGFEYVCVSHECNSEYITMALVDTTVMSADECTDQNVAMCQVAQNGAALFEGVCKQMKKFGIKPPKSLKRSHK